MTFICQRSNLVRHLCNLQPDSVAQMPSTAKVFVMLSFGFLFYLVVVPFLLLLPVLFLPLSLSDTLYWLHLLLSFSPVLCSLLCLIGSQCVYNSCLLSDSNAHFPDLCNHYRFFCGVDFFFPT